MRDRKVFVLLFFLLAHPSEGAIPPSSVKTDSKASLNERLARVRKEVVGLEQSLIESLKSNQRAKESIRKIQELMSLQKEERRLGKARMHDLEETVKSLEARRGVIRERVMIEREAIRKSLRELSLGEDVLPGDREAIEQESFEQARFQLMRRMVQSGIREIDALRADLEDADRLEMRISSEKGELEATIHEMAESEGILELNRQLQIDLIKRNRADRLSQLERWRKMKTAEAQVSELIRTFNARMEIQEVSRAERASRKAEALMASSSFGRLKGRLPLPVHGKIVGHFGKGFDSESGLNVFKKGIEIASASSTEIRAISPGKIVYAGQMPSYGLLTIIDHGEHFYSICGHLGEISKKVGDPVKQGEKIGVSDSSGTPVYFEIRAKNIPVDPMQWIAASL